PRGLRLLHGRGRRRGDRAGAEERKQQDGDRAADHGAVPHSCRRSASVVSHWALNSCALDPRQARVAKPFSVSIASIFRGGWSTAYVLPRLNRIPPCSAPSSPGTARAASSSPTISAIAPRS